MRSLCKAAQWFLVAITLLFALPAMNQILPLIFFIAAFAVVFPPIAHQLVGRLPWLEKGVAKFFLWLALVSIAFSLMTSLEEQAQNKIDRLAEKKDVPALIAILEEEDTYESPYAAAALGNLGDQQAVAPLISALDATKPDIRSESATALGKLNDPAAIDPLVDRLNDPDTTVSKSVRAAFQELIADDPKIVDRFLPDFRKGDEGAKAALVAIGEPAIDPMIAALNDPDFTVLGNAADVLGEIGDPRAIEPLKSKLVDWYSGSLVAPALQRLNWQPESDADKVHLWVALRDGAQLETNWATTKEVLLNDVASGNSDQIEYGIYSFMALGNSEILPTLVTLLNEKGNETTALAYLNCGEPTLEQAAEDWATARGYEIIQTQEPVNTVTWGQGM